MSIWLRLLTISLIIGFCKATQLVKLIILTGLGLAGLWMLHILAEDFGNIYNNFQRPDKKPMGRFFSKRSIDDGSHYVTKLVPKSDENMKINWEKILSNDALGCTQSYVCQLVATDSKKLLKEEKSILFLVRSASFTNNWAGKQLYGALKYGEKMNPQRCKIKYESCPFSSYAMTFILRLIGRTNSSL